MYVVGPPVTTFVVAPAVPDKFTPAAVKPLTGSLNTTVKLIGDAEVGSGCAAAVSYTHLDVYNRQVQR